MSKLQTQAQPLLSPIILNGSIQPSSVPDRRTMARWVMMTTAVAEFADMPTVALSSADRRRIKEDDLDSDWFIGLAPYSGTRFQTAFFHRAVRFLAPGGRSDAAQLTIFAIGRLFVHAVGASDGGREVFGQPVIYAMNHGLWGIWPTATTAIMNRPRAMTDEAARRLLANASGNVVHDLLANR